MTDRVLPLATAQPSTQMMKLPRGSVECATGVER
jgi:hypothetical protein